MVIRENFHQTDKTGFIIRDIGISDPARIDALNVEYSLREDVAAGYRRAFFNDRLAGFKRDGSQPHPHPLGNGFQYLLKT